MFLAHKLTIRKARERELATFDESRRAVGMLNPMRDTNEGILCAMLMKARTEGEEERHL